MREAFKTQDLWVNMGPQHPSTHGVLRLILALQGERIVDMEVVIGYLHRGTEKLGEFKTYHQFIPLTDRLDYIAANAMNHGYVVAVEKLAEIEVPERAEYIRVLMAELSRISSHLLWLATHALDIGAMTVFLYCFREREMILDLFEMATGGRLTTTYFRIGGVADDLPEGFIDKCKEFCEIFPERVKDYDDLLYKNRIWLSRTVNIAKISAEKGLSLGLSGPSIRGSGVNWDLRRSNPYSVYDKLDFEVAVFDGCDVYARYLVRRKEMLESCKIVKQCLEWLEKNPGPVRAKVPKVFKPPVGEVYAAVEAPKGELGYYIVSDGSTRPYRIKIRAPSFANLMSLPEMCKGHLVADVIAAIGSIDIVLGEVDR
ncbi:MAG: NADH-quinone oxidoreductase subunit D [Deferribacteres bacterium]|nr:NADH-quinone oxidoreductase subunit D [Deferribacteres bacterium]